MNELAKILIAKESISPHDAGCQDVIREHLTKIGFDIVGLSKENTTNTWAIRRWSDGPLLVLAGHTDVVPVGDMTAWESNPFELTVRNGNLYGRGIADMKGSVAAMVTATEEFVAEQKNIAGGIAFLITSDEEADRTHGTRYAVEELLKQGVQADYVLLGEPSSIAEVGDRIYVARRGSHHLKKCVITGLPGHVAKDNGIDASEIATRIQYELLNTEWDENPDPGFPNTSVKSWVLAGGFEVPNMISSRVELYVNWRNNPASPSTLIEEKFEALAHRVYKQVAGDKEPTHEPLEFTWAFSGEPYATDTSSPFIAKIQSALAHSLKQTPQLSGGGGTSDGGALALLGADVVELGLQGGSIHEANEHVPVGALEQLEQAYLAILKEVLVQK